MTSPRTPLRPVGSLVVLTGLNLLDYLDRQLLASVLTPVKRELGLTDEELGTLQSAFMWGYFLTSPLFGYLGDRLPRRWLVAMGVFVWSVGTLMTGHVSAWWGLLFFRILVGFGEASFGTISPGWIADLFPASRRNTAVSVFYLAIPVGSALGYIFGSAMAARYGWRSAFLWAGYPGLLLAGLLLLLREPERGAADQTAPAKGEGWAGYVRLLGFPRYLLVVAGYSAQTFALGAFALWAPTFLHRVHGMPVEAAGVFFGAAVVTTGLVATLAGGLAATGWQRRTGRGYEGMLVAGSALAVPAGWLSFALSDPTASKVAIAVTMFCLFLTVGPVNTLILETVPVAMRATAMAGSIFAIHLFGDLWSPGLVGLLSDRTGDLRTACLWLLPPALVASAACWLLLRCRPPERAAA